ncbi:hypothetical protein K6V90_00010 [Cupriavidus pauculus]|uniref:esterase/lipase family protein n=1 Tax=Cupriavidus pauculus TaxID=82633 RepID=UPI001C9328EC|nr:hypothetical protein [Cupriavidus pauculus]MBY4728918.1 hypothetical protein [Cupriavidus pauculus]
MDTERILPRYVSDDGAVHYTSTMSVPDDSVGACYLIPDRIIPVIFVPGIMGSNLMDRKNRSVWRADSIWSVVSAWANAPADKRKSLLDPSETFVDPRGELPTNTLLSKKELQRRGWGEVSAMSYGDFLAWLDHHLNDYHSETAHGRNGLRAGLMKQVLKSGPTLAPLTHEEVLVSYQYQFPVHAVGYNWLESNRTSAERLQSKVREFTTYYRNKGRPCEKVILVTHSMGGLVARHYSEVLGGSNDILGIVHGVMPATGAAAAYKRVKAGTEGAAGLALGDNAAAVTAVFAQAPGALQLLPSPDYGMGWLKIRDYDRIVSLPKQDPYEEIYLQRGKWWGLIGDRFLNPLDPNRQTLDQDWRGFKDLINTHVRTFHTKISGKYHPNSYVFYGDDQNAKTWGDVTWKRTISPNMDGSIPKLVPYVRDLEGGQVQWDHGYGRQGVSIEGGLPGDSAYFVLQAPDETGDGTVPARSGKAPRGRKGVQACVPFSGFGHEGAYKDEPEPGLLNWSKNEERRRFTLWAITRIAHRIQSTDMACVL